MAQNGDNNAKEPNNSDEPNGPAPRPAGESLVGRRLGKYRVLRRLGGGGMGIVYEAEDAVLKRPVALKVLSPRIATDPNATRRFLQEARAAARLSHPNIVSIYEVGQRDGIVFLAMELVRGRSLQERLQSSERIPWREAARIVSQVCLALEAAHAAGLIHRDIKPANILLRESDADRGIRDSRTDDNVKLVDFGLAKTLAGEAPQITSANTLLGTPSYMSPEQCRGETIDERSDLYALGATFFTLLTGHPPYVHEEALQLMFAHCSAEIPSTRVEVPDVPVECDEIIRQALAKDAFARFESARALRYALKPLLADPGSTPSPPPPPPQPPPVVGATWVAQRTQSIPSPVAPPPAGTPPAGTPPAGTPPTGTPRTETPPAGSSLTQAMPLDTGGPRPPGVTNTGEVGPHDVRFSRDRLTPRVAPNHLGWPVTAVVTVAALGLLLWLGKILVGPDPAPMRIGGTSTATSGTTSSHGTTKSTDATSGAAAQGPAASGVQPEIIERPKGLPETLDILANREASLPGPVTCFALARSGRIVAIATEASPSHGSESPLIMVWDLGSRKLIWWRAFEGYARAMRFTASEDSLWVAAGSGGAFGFRVADGQVIAHSPTPDGAVQSVEILPDDNSAVFGLGRWTDAPGLGGEILLVDVRSGKIRERWDEPGKVYAIKATPDGRRLLLCQGGLCEVHDPNNLRLGRQLSRIDTGRRLITAIDISPDAKFVALADDSGRLLVHELPGGAPVLSEDSQPVFGKISSLTFLADEKFICLGAGEGQNLRCVNTYTGREESLANTLDIARADLRIHDAYVSCLFFDRASRQLWTSSHDMRVCVTGLKK